MPPPNKHIIIIAGEASGDMHGSDLVEKIKLLDPNIAFSGLGGKSMQKSGVEIYRDLTQLAVVGFSEVIKHYDEIKVIFNLILKKIHTLRPCAVILIDYPGFNLRLAKKLRRLNLKVVYYISPQVWAWKQNRVHFIKKYIDKMIVLFEFEKTFYAKFGIEACFSGHPLMDKVKSNSKKEEFLQSLDLEDYKITIGILPGSRQKEVERLLPIMLQAAAIISKKFPMAQFLIIKAPTIDSSLLDNFLMNSSLSCKIIEKTYDGINASDICMVASGTATLETAILQKPMVVVYKTSFLTWVLAKLFVKIPDIGLVNVVAGKRIVPECVQYQATGENIAQSLIRIFTDENKASLIKSDLKKVKESLGSGGASLRAAEEILKMIN